MKNKMKNKMKNHLKLVVLTLLFLMLTGISALAAGYSSAWYQENGVWKVKGPDGQPLKNCWFCDDAVFENGQNVWYLLDANGNMISSPLVRDRNGNYYSLETDHDGHYGSLRYQSGTYDGTRLVINEKHDGSFGALKNQSGIEELDALYGTQNIYIDSNNCVYSSSWLGKTADPATKAQSGLAPDGSGSTTSDNVYREIRYYLGGQLLGVDKGYTRYFTVKRYDVDGFVCWKQNFFDEEIYPGDMYYFEGNQTSASFYAMVEY